MALVSRARSPRPADDQDRRERTVARGGEADVTPAVRLGHERRAVRVPRPDDQPLHEPGGRAQAPDRRGRVRELGARPQAALRPGGEPRLAAEPDHPGQHDPNTYGPRTTGSA